MSRRRSRPRSARAPAAGPRRPGPDRRVAATDGTHAGATLVYDLRRGDWDTDLMADLGLDRVAVPGHPALRRRRRRAARDARRRVGLAAGMPVVLGGADSQACALGVGVVAPGPVSEMAGSSTCLNAAVPAPLDVLAVTHYPHVIPGPFTTETGINTTGAAIAWLAGLLYGGRSGRADRRRLRPARCRGGARRVRVPMESSPCRSWATASGPTRTCAAPSSGCRSDTAVRSSSGRCSKGWRSRWPTSSTSSGLAMPP